MRVRFGELSASELREKERLCAEARQAWRCVREADDARACQLIELADPRLVAASPYLRGWLVEGTVE